MSNFAAFFAVLFQSMGGAAIGLTIYGITRLAGYASSLARLCWFVQVVVTLSLILLCIFGALSPEYKSGAHRVFAWSFVMVLALAGFLFGVVGGVL